MKAVLFAAGMVLVLIASYLFRNQGLKAGKGLLPFRKEIVPLEELSGIWLDRKAYPENTESTAPAIPVQGNRDGKDEEAAVFGHPEAQEFYDKQIKPSSYFKGTPGRVVGELLSLLDREGGCPSVVNITGEEEGKLPGNIFDLLAKTRLLQHTLNVTGNMIESLGGSGPLIPKAVITALAHDLGKIPSYRTAMYSTGDHPLISIGVLNQIKGFDALPAKERDEIFRAIKDHHRSSGEFLCVKLKEADQAARRKELAENTRNMVLSPSCPPSKEEREDTDSLSDTLACTFGSSEKDEKVKITPREQAMPWFNPQEFLQELRPYINRLDGGRWDAFSMSSGYVYFQVKVLWEAAKKIARKKDSMDVLLGDGDEELRQNILYSIVSRLRTEKDAIARGLIRDTYFGAPFVVTMKDGRKFDKGYYTPFNAEAFSSTVSELEALKVGRLKDIVDVNPKYE